MPQIGLGRHSMKYKWGKFNRIQKYESEIMFSLMNSGWVLFCIYCKAKKERFHSTKVNVLKDFSICIFSALIRITCGYSKKYRDKEDRGNGLTKKRRPKLVTSVPVILPHNYYFIDFPVKFT